MVRYIMITSEDIRNNPEDYRTVWVEVNEVDKLDDYLKKASTEDIDELKQALEYDVDVYRKLLDIGVLKVIENEGVYVKNDNDSVEFNTKEENHGVFNLFTKWIYEKIILKNKK